MLGTQNTGSCYRTLVWRSQEDGKVRRAAWEALWPQNIEVCQTPQQGKSVKPFLLSILQPPVNSSHWPQTTWSQRAKSLGWWNIWDESPRHGAGNGGWRKDSRAIQRITSTLGTHYLSLKLKSHDHEHHGKRLPFLLVYEFSSLSSFGKFSAKLSQS